MSHQPADNIFLDSCFCSLKSGFKTTEKDDWNRMNCGGPSGFGRVGRSLILNRSCLCVSINIQAQPTVS